MKDNYSYLIFVEPFDYQYQRDQQVEPRNNFLFPMHEGQQYPPPQIDQLLFSWAKLAFQFPSEIRNIQDLNLQKVL